MRHQVRGIRSQSLRDLPKAAQGIAVSVRSWREETRGEATGETRSWAVYRLRSTGARTFALSSVHRVAEGQDEEVQDTETHGQGSRVGTTGGVQGLKIKLDKYAFMPVREHITDAGLDVKAIDDGIVRARSSALFHTGVHVQLPKGTAGLFVSKSGMMVNHGITSTGLVDEGYDGEVMVKLFNHGDKDYEIKRGDKIAQLVVMPVMYEPVEIVRKIDGGERGSAGFGSTDRKRTYRDRNVKQKARYYAKGEGRRG